MTSSLLTITDIRSTLQDYSDQLKEPHHMATRKIPLVTPGEVLRNDFLEPMGISAYRLAADTGMTQTRVKEILDGTRSVTADAALRLGCFFGTDAQWWLNMQAYYDLEKTKEENGREIVRAVKPWQQAV